MTLRRLAAALCVLISSSLNVSAGSNQIPKKVRKNAELLRDSALDGTRAFELVRSLSFEASPRPAGSAGDRAGVAWALRTFEELGFSNVRAEKVVVPHWERGLAAGRVLAAHPHDVVLVALGGSVGTPEQGITAEVMEVESVEALEQLEPDAAKGKIVFINKRMPRERDGSGYGPTVQGRVHGASKAAALGAVAVIIRSVGTSKDRIAHTGGMRYAADINKIPAAALSIPDADLLEYHLASGKTVRFWLKLTSRTLPDAMSANVIGEIPGRERADEFVLLGAHLDSWDLGQGAVDDGAGCAIVMEAARRIGQFHKQRGLVGPRRSIRVVLFANEEFGLSGAKAYAEAHKQEMPKHIVAAESDFGAGRIYRFGAKVGPKAQPLVDAIYRVLKPLEIEPAGDRAGGADLSPMKDYRVPIVGLGQDGTDYFDLHHTANDTVDKIDPKELDQNVAAYAAFAYLAAELEADFGRTAKPEEP